MPAKKYTSIEPWGWEVFAPPDGGNSVVRMTFKFNTLEGPMYRTVMDFVTGEDYDPTITDDLTAAAIAVILSEGYVLLS